MKIITLTTDFGTTDTYVASMKGVMLTHCPTATLVDVTHEIPPQDVLAGQIILEDVCQFFPKGSIHLAVVDPGVGTKRFPIIVEANGNYFVGPDNGIFSFAMETESPKIWKINTERFEPKRSRTFDGRDVFAPVAAMLAAGMPPEELGTVVASMKRLEVPDAVIEGGQISGEVIYIDHFGNIITNIRRNQAQNFRGPVVITEHSVTDFEMSYGDVSHSDPIVIWNSLGRLEIAVRNGSAAEMLGVKRKTPVICKGVER